MMITLDLVVTLPRHDQPNDLSEELRTNWERFATRVAMHEQRHVDIYLDGAKTMKALVEATLTKWFSCSELEKTIRGVWTSQQAETETAQEQFHIEDGKTTQTDWEPLQVQVEVNRARLAAIDSEIRRLDLTRDQLRHQLDATRAKIDAVKGDMTNSDGTLSSCAKARPASRLKPLCDHYNSLVAVNNALAEKHNGMIGRLNDLADEYNQLAAATNVLIEALKWTR